MKYRKTTTKDLEILRNHENKEAVKILCVKAYQVANMRARYGIYLRESTNKELLPEIKDMVDSGLSPARIARRLGKKYQTIYAIIKRHGMKK